MKPNNILVSKSLLPSNKLAPSSSQSKKTIRTDLLEEQKIRKIKHDVRNIVSSISIKIFIS
jgi:hypothetical protein